MGNPEGLSKSRILGFQSRDICIAHQTAKQVADWFHITQIQICTDYIFSLIYKSRLYKNKEDKYIKYQFLVLVTERLRWFPASWIG